MEQTPKRSSKTLKIAALIIIIIVAFVGILAVITYPRVIVSLPGVSFTLGGTVRQEFDVPFLHSQVQVEVSVASGLSLWTVRITRNDDEIWSHSIVQGGQTTYKSEWIPISTGHYNLTLEMLEIGSLEADVSVTSKGGFW